MNSSDSILGQPSSDQSNSYLHIDHTLTAHRVISEEALLNNAVVNTLGADEMVASRAVVDNLDVDNVTVQQTTLTNATITNLTLINPLPSSAGSTSAGYYIASTYDSSSPITVNGDIGPNFFHILGGDNELFSSGDVLEDKKNDEWVIQTPGVYRIELLLGITSKVDGNFSFIRICPVINGTAGVIFNLLLDTGAQTPSSLAFSYTFKNYYQFNANNRFKFRFLNDSMNLNYFEYQYQRFIQFTKMA